jgi:hypothetical protein
MGVPDVQLKATPYWVVPGGNCSISGPLLGNDAAIQLPAPIFCATATGVGAANEIATLFAAGVGVGVTIGVEPPPQPVEMITKEASKTTSHADRLI